VVEGRCEIVELENCNMSSILIDFANGSIHAPRNARAVNSDHPLVVAGRFAALQADPPEALRTE
jgi:hypothetical protein